MNIKSRDIKRGLRDLENIAHDLINSNLQNYLSLLKRFIDFTESNVIVHQIVHPLFEIEIDHRQYLNDNSRGRKEFIVPEDSTIHIALVLQVFIGLVEKRYDLYGFLIDFFKQRDIAENLNLFNFNIVEPALRNLIIKIKDFIEDEVEGRDELDVNEINIFNIGNISNQDGNVVIGNNIAIENSKDVLRLTEKFLQEMLSQGYGLKQFDEIRHEIESLQAELQKEKPDKSFLDKVVKKVFDIGGKAMVQILVDLASRPELYVAAGAFIK